MGVLGSMHISGHVREQIRRNQVDKDVKVFSVGDEFVIHSFKAHLTARVYTTLGLHSTSDTIPHEKIPCMASINSREASHRDLPMHIPSSDTLYSMHRTLLHTGFLYVDLRHAIRYENGPHIVRLWKLWLPRLIETGRKNYAVECQSCQSTYRL